MQKREKDKDMSSNIEQAIRESANTNTIVRVTVSGHDIVSVMTEIRMMDLVQDADYSPENDGTWDVYGTTETGEEFRLRVTCNA